MSGTGRGRTGDHVRTGAVLMGGLGEKEAEKFAARVDSVEFEIGPDGKVYAFTPKEKGGSGRKYRIREATRVNSGECYCECPQWIFRERKKGQPCKHLVAWYAKGADLLAVLDPRVKEEMKRS